jgi:hypothetical protein
MYELGLLAYYGEGLEKEYAQKWLKEEKSAREDWINQVNSLQATMPEGEKYIVDWSKMKITGIESEYFGKSMKLKDYQSKIDELNKKIDEPSIKIQVKDIPEFKIIEPETKKDTSIWGGDMFPIVSAQKLTGVVRTTTPPSETERIREIHKEQGGGISGAISTFAKVTAGKVGAGLQKIGVFDYSQATGVVRGIETGLSVPNIAIKPVEFIFKEITKPAEAPKVPEFKYSQVPDVFIKPSPSGGTGIIRFPTQKESRTIYRTFSENPERIIERQRKIQELYKGFEQLSYEEQQKRLSMIRAYGGGQPIEYTYMGVTQDLNPERLDYKTPTGFRQSARQEFLSLTAQKKIVSKGYPEKGFFYTTPEKTVKVRLPTYGTVQTDPFTGEVKDFKLTEVIIPEKTGYQLSAEQVGGVAATSIYFTPYNIGLGLFASEAGLKLTEEIKQEKGITKGAIKFFKDYPAEATLVGGYGLYKLGKGIKTFAFTPREKVLLESLESKIPSSARNIMSKEEVIGITDKGLVISRQFLGKGIAEEITQGQRTYFSTRFQDWFKLKPTYSGKYTGDVLKIDYPLLRQGEKTIEISAKEARAGYQKVKEMLIEKRGMTESQAKEYLRRVSPKRTGYATSYGGEIVVGETTPIIDIQGIRLSGGLKESVSLKPTKRITIESPAKIGKPKAEEVSTLLEEYKTITPKGKEAGEVGELSFFKGKGEEFDVTKQLGKKTKQFEERAIAKKTGEEAFDLGTIETYKTGEVSKEITYLKPKRVSGSQAEVVIINPEIQKQTTIDLVSGLKTVKVKPAVKTDIGIVSAEDWIKVSEETLPFRKTVADVISPAKITKTPMSKTFGETGQQTKQVFEPVKITKEAKQQLVSDVSKILKPSKVKQVKTPQVLIESNYPKMVGGTGIVESSFVGGASTFEEVSSKTMPEIKMNVLSNVQNKEESRLKDNLGISQVDVLKTNLKFDVGLKTKPQTKVNEQFKMNEMLKMKVGELQKTEQQQAQKTTQRTTQKTTQKINRTPPKPKIKIPIPIPVLSIPKRILNKVQESPDTFSVFIKKQGEDILVSKVASKEKAKDILLGKLGQTLRASGFIQKGKEKLKVSELGNLGMNFGKSKKIMAKVYEKTKNTFMGSGDFSEPGVSLESDARICSL